MNSNEVRAQYIEHGYDCIPLKPLTKDPLSKGWQDREPFRQWKNAPEGANFGLRAGNGKAFVDCDNKKNPETFSNVSSWLAGLGYQLGSYPVVQTASGIGRHIYVNFASPMLGSYRNLTQIGTGEFRFGKGAQVAAPPSITMTGTYRLLEGDMSQLPTLDIRDIAALVKVNETDGTTAPRMSSLARALAMGEGIERYQSRSEAEAALVLSLVNSRFEYADVLQVFETSPCFGKYADLKATNRKKAEAYLLHTFNNAVEYQRNESPTRRTIRQVQVLAEGAAWGCVTDKLIFLAHTQIAYKAGRLVYAASRRDLALEAGITDIAAMNATKRLILDERLILQERSAAKLATRYFLPVDKNYHSLTPKYLGSGNVCPLPAQVVENGRVLDLDGLEQSDAFRNGKDRLGRRAGQVYKLLFGNSLTPSEIANRTGASLKTVRRTLAKLANVRDYKTGEILELVSCDGGRWHSNVVDLEIIEAIYGTRGAKEKQRITYEKERREHRKSLQLGALKT